MLWGKLYYKIGKARLKEGKENKKIIRATGFRLAQVKALASGGGILQRCFGNNWATKFVNIAVFPKWSRTFI